MVVYVDCFFLVQVDIFLVLGVVSDCESKLDILVVIFFFLFFFFILVVIYNLVLLLACHITVPFKMAEMVNFMLCVFYCNVE